MKEFKETYFPLGWLRRLDDNGPVVDWTKHNLFDLKIKDSETKDDSPLNNKADLTVTFTYENNEITFVQHMTIGSTEWIDNYDQNKLGKNFTYDLQVKDLATNLITIYEVNLKRAEARVEEKISPEAIKAAKKELNGRPLEVITELDDNPFDTDF